MSETFTRKLLVIALDGATWDLLDGWLKEGKLPNLQRLINGGVSAALESTIPPISPTAWLSFFTGKNPGHHGVYDFFRPLRRHYTDLIPSTADLNQQPTLWGILSQWHRPVCVVNVPMTFPAEKVTGCIIPGAPAPAVFDAAYPPGLLAELQEQGWDLTRDATLVKGSYEEMFQSLKDLVNTRVEATCYLLKNKPWDFFMVHFLETDQAGHTFWRFLEKEGNPYQNSMLSIFEVVDEGVGKILKTAGDVPVILMSDHGMGAVKYHLNLNNWLLQEGSMQWKRRISTALRRFGYRLGLSPSFVYNLLPSELTQRLTLGELRTGLAQIPTEHVGQHISGFQKLVKTISRWLFLSFDDIDWASTVAYSTGTTQVGFIYLNVRGREPHGIVNEGAEYEYVRAQIAERLLTFVDPYTNRSLVKRVYRREELYCGPYYNDGPDLIVEYNYGEYDQKKGPIFMSTHSVQRVRDANAAHRMEGIFLMCAPGMAVQDAKIEKVHLIDIAPTVFYMLGEKVPREFEGQVIERAFTDEYRSTHPMQMYEEALTNLKPEGEVSPEELEDILERLHGLGYV